MFFFFNDTATTEIYTLSLHDAAPGYPELCLGPGPAAAGPGFRGVLQRGRGAARRAPDPDPAHRPAPGPHAGGGGQPGYPARTPLGTHRGGRIPRPPPQP